MSRADIIRAELERIRDRVPAWLAAEGAPRGRFTARELDLACRRHGPCAPGSACRMLRAMRDELGVRCVDRARGLYEVVTLGVACGIAPLAMALARVVRRE